MATYYVRASGGNDTNDGLSFANGWATIQKAVDTAQAGDLVLICSDGTHLPTSAVSFNTYSGTAGNLIMFRGAGAAGEDDGTGVTISGTSLAAGADLFQFVTVTGARNISLENMRLTAGKTHNIDTVGAQNNIFLRNCRLDNAAADGYRMDNASSSVTMLDCEIDNNGSRGIGQSTTSRGAAHMTGCSIHHNTSHGFDLGRDSILTGCVVYRNGGSGYRGQAGSVRAIGCTFFNNTNDGIEDYGGMEFLGGHNIFAKNGGYGVKHNGAARSDKFNWVYNLYFSNTTAPTDDPTGGGLDDTDYAYISGSDPEFISETDGAENFAVSGTSPVRDAGFPGVLPTGGTGYRDIGAIQSRAARRLVNGGLLVQ